MEEKEIILTNVQKLMMGKQVFSQDFHAALNSTH
jgi:hypothetical protein